MPGAIPPAVHTIATTTRGRYLVRACSEPVGLLVGFHGYGQDAETLLADVVAIEGTANWLVVSVQGLHRFYTRSNQVVASWMTSQDRELAIEDNVAYVRAVVAHVSRESGLATTDAPSRPIVFAGFSQGVAMAFRAAARVTGSAGVIALGGDVPPDIRTEAPPLPPVLLGRGTKDDWYTREKLEADVGWLKTAGIDATFAVFEGGHSWSDAFRGEAAKFLARIGTHR